MSHKTLLSTMGLILVALAIACAPTASTPTLWSSPYFVASDCSFEVPSSVDEKCGTVTVPQNHSRDDGLTFDLAVAVFASQASKPQADPVVYLAGGPGEHALDTLVFTFDDLFRPFLSTRDVVVFDQRGAGYSEPNTDCIELNRLEIDLLNLSLSLDEEVELNIAAATTCHDRLTSEGVPLEELTTAQSAADVEAIMIALGYSDWNLLGISYGTRLAQAIMRDRPAGVRSVILDSVVPLEIDLIAQTPGSFDRGLTALFNGCAASIHCAADYPNLEETLVSAVTNLNKAPVTGSISNQLTQESFKSISDGTDLVNQVFQGLYSSEVIPLLPEMISLAAQLDTDLLDLLRGISLTSSPFLSTGMHIALQCTEEFPFTTKERIRLSSESHARVLKLLGGSSPIGSEVFDICAYWNLTAAPAVENEPVMSDIPTLIFAGSYDPITPPSGGRLLADRLGNATFVEFPASGHAALTTGECALGIASGFLAAPNRFVDNECAKKQEPFAWVRPLKATEFEFYSNRFFGYLSVKPIGWAELAPGVFGRSQLGVVTLLEQLVQDTTVEQVLDLIQRATVDSSAFLRFGSHTSEHYEWQLFRASVSGQVMLVALSQGDLATAFIMVTGLPGQEDTLIEAVLEPVLQEFAPFPES